MTSVVIEPLDYIVDAALPHHGCDALRGFSAELLRVVSAAKSKDEVLAASAQLVSQHATPVTIVYYGRNSQGLLAESTRLYPTDDDARTQRLSRQLLPICESACRNGSVEVRHQTVPPRVLVAAPIILQGSAPEAIGAVFSSEYPIASLVLLSQVVANHLVLWNVLAAGRDSERDARDTASLVEMLDTVAGTPGFHAACMGLVADLQSHWKCSRVAVGLRSAGARGPCRLMAVSGVAHFDPRSPSTRAFEAAMDEAILRNDVTVWPVAEDDSAGVLAHKNLSSLEDGQVIVSTPLRDREGVAVGALVLLRDSAEGVSHCEHFLRASERSIAQSLMNARQLEGNRFIRFCRRIRQIGREWKAKLALAAAVVAILAMAIPYPYRVYCDCQLEPVTRRFIAAPFESTLEKSLVKPGDSVQAGDLLARLDGREIRWKRASVAADQQQAMKKRDAAQAAHNYAEMQIAALEVERLEQELRLLDYRAENLEIRSPVTGVVVTGDLERAEGAPLVVGQSLFEIAPLEQIVVEVAVPDAEVSFVRSGQPMTVRLDAYPREIWQAEVMKIHPRSEIRDDKNVFVAEAVLDNPHGRLSPGMKGRVHVDTPHRSLGWILFHRPWEYVTKKLHW